MENGVLIAKTNRACVKALSQQTVGNDDSYSIGFMKCKTALVHFNPIIV